MDKGNKNFQGKSLKNDRSVALRDTAPLPVKTHPARPKHRALGASSNQTTAQDPVREAAVAAPAMPATLSSFDGIPFPGVACYCAPPDTNGEAGDTQYVQIVNEGYQVFNKATGASVLGPVGIATIWSGFGGVCETGGQGDPIVLYDQLANRWLVSEFAGSPQPKSASPFPRQATRPAPTTATPSTWALTSSTTRTWRSGRTATT